MGDLISRQNLIMTLTVTAEETEQIKVGDLKKVINVINNQPSAQQWIPVEKETPILPNIVLVCDSLGKILFDSYIDGVWVYCPYVVAWMPLPEPYKEDAMDAATRAV